MFNKHVIKSNIYIYTKVIVGNSSHFIQSLILKGDMEKHLKI